MITDMSGMLEVIVLCCLHCIASISLLANI